MLGLVATIGFASYALWARGQVGPEALPSGERTPLTLQIGDIVEHVGTDWIVEGVLDFAGEESGPRPRLYRLVDGARERYLWVQPGADPLLLDETTPPVEAEGQMVAHGGRELRLRESSHATALRVGVVGGSRAGGRVRIKHYTAGVVRLLVLEWGDRVDAFAGERVSPGLLELLPAK